MELAITIIHLIVCIVLTAVVLFQSGKNAGLSGAIAGNTDSFLARNKSNSLDAKLAKATKWIAIIFVVITLILNIV